jgi:hypothetical protein
MPTQLRLDGSDEILLNEVRVILKDDNGKVPTSKDTVRKSLQIVKDQSYQLNGADVRRSVNTEHF